MSLFKISSKKERNETRQMETRATSDMCIHCFDVLIDKLSYSNPNSSSSLLDSLPNSNSSCPLFITWSKQRRSTSSEIYDLRGCIGSLHPQNLLRAIPQYALVSALSDQRFQPISKSEIPLLKVSVSLLVDYEELGTGLDYCYDWVVGVHGIMIQFQGLTLEPRTGFFSERRTKQTTYNATFLPEVAREQGWTQQQTIQSLIRKAGYNDEITNDVLQSIHLTRYKSSKYSLSYDEYLTLKKQSTNH